MIDDTYRQLLSGTLLDPVPCNGCVTQTLCFVGLWEEGDPEHPDGGSITYVNPAGETITQDLIWQGNVVTIEFIDIISYVGIYEINCTPQVQCFEGIWEEGDPEHPDGGSVTYINADGDTVTQDLIWLGDIVVIDYLEIISFTGVVEIDCASVELTEGLRSDGFESSDICGEALENDVFIYGNVGCEILIGNLACNTNNILDPFIGNNEYYTMYLLICDTDLYTYVCKIDNDGVITEIENCPAPPP
jgi:hypothetical protein